MQRAEQNKLFQDTNISIVEIRKAEIDYFTTFYSTFSTQAFLLVTFLMVGISQRPPDAYKDICGADCPLFLLVPFSIFAGSSVAINAIIILKCVFINVFGNWLAIHGKEGSMADAVSGMVTEQYKIVIAFVLGLIFLLFSLFLSFILYHSFSTPSCMFSSFFYYFLGIFCFQAQQFCVFYILMDEPWDSVCGFIMVAFLLWTYRCTLRIYNTFKFDENDETSWNIADSKEKRRKRGKDDIGEGEVPLDAEERERLLDEFFENLSNDVLTDLMKESGQHNPQMINHLYKQSLHKGFLKAEDSLEAKKSYMLTLISSSVERMSESLNNVRASFTNRMSLSALPALPRVSLQEMPMLPRMSFTGAAASSAAVPTSSEQSTDPSVAGDAEPIRSSFRGSFRGSLQSLMSPQPSITASSVAGDLPLQNPLHTGSARPSITASARPSVTASVRPSVSQPYPPPPATQNRGSLGLRGSLQSMRSPTASIDFVARPSLRGSLTAIGNQISFMNPLPSFLRDSRTFKDPREIELETHSPPPIRVIVGELMVKMAPHPKRKNNSNSSSLFSSALCSSCTAPSKVEKWIKSYFVLKGITLYYYENELTFITSPDSPLNKEEPVSLVGYELKRGLPVPPFAFSLKVRSVEEQEKGTKKTLRFRCDNISIFKHWTERLEEILDELLQQEIMKEFY
jgi:hypothetical protein